MTNIREAVRAILRTHNGYLEYVEGKGYRHVPGEATTSLEDSLVDYITDTIRKVILNE